MRTIWIFALLCGLSLRLSGGELSQSGQPWKGAGVVALATEHDLIANEDVDSQYRSLGNLVAEVRVVPVLDALPKRYTVDVPGFMRSRLLVEVVLRNVGSEKIQVPTRTPTGLPWLCWKGGTLGVVYQFFPNWDMKTGSALQLPEADYGPVTLSQGQSTKLASVIIPRAAIVGKNAIVVAIAIEEGLQRRTGWPGPIEVEVLKSNALAAIHSDLAKYPE